jgi:hypothetical protein
MINNKIEKSVMIAFQFRICREVTTEIECIQYRAGMFLYKLSVNF